jgi:circadian clock protein KaiC
MMFALATPEKRALYFTALGEPPIKMLRYQQAFSFFDVDKLQDSIRFVNIGHQFSNHDYDQALKTIFKEVQDFGPAFVFVDSFRSIIDVPIEQPMQGCNAQRFLQQLASRLSNWQASTFVIGDYSHEESQHNPLFTIADGIIWLIQDLHRNSMVRKLQIIKMRGRDQIAGLHTFRISEDGLRVFPRIFSIPHVEQVPAAARPTDRLGMGNEVLDRMLGGGLPVGYTMLVVGPSGSGKTRVATAFLGAGARRGEHGVIATFDKRLSQKADSELDLLIQQKKISVLTMLSLDLSIDQVLDDLSEMLDDGKSTRLVFDSLSGFELALAPEFRENFRESLYRLITALTARGVTVLLTTDLEDRYTELQFSPFGNAFLVDAILLQRYVAIAGQLKTLLTVVKLRGSSHSHDLRLYDITSEGLQIAADAFIHDGALTGCPTVPDDFPDTD